MWNFQDTFETRKQSFISAFSVCMTVPLTHNEVKYIVVERFIRTLNNRIYKDKTALSKNVYIDKLDEIVDK